MSQELPLEVFGLVAPILMWVERRGEEDLPVMWRDQELGLNARRRGWLVAQLPTASYDKLYDMVRLSHEKYEEGQGLGVVSKGVDPGTRQIGDQIEIFHRGQGGDGSASLTPPRSYDLAATCSWLAKRYFETQGTTVRVRDRRSEELHVLALRFPVGQVIRQIHAEWVASDLLSAEEVRELPEEVGLLATTAQGAGAVAERRLAEGHLHLNAVTSAHDVWCENLLTPTDERVELWLQGWRGPGRSGGRQAAEAERRLLRLGRVAGRILAFAVLMSKLRYEGPAPRTRLLTAFDRLYFARNAWERRGAEDQLRRMLADACRRLETLRIPRELAWLVLWVDPSRVELGGGVGRRGRGPADPRRRTDAVAELHFEAQYALVAARRPSDAVRWRFVHEALYRYLVVRTHHWQLAVQHSRTTGFRYFKKFYDSKQRRPAWVPHQYQRRVFKRLAQWRGLRILEGRISPPDEVAEDLEPWVAEGAHALRKGQLDRFGLVLHFIKDEAPARITTGVEQWASVRDGWLRRRTYHQALRLFRILTASKPVVPFIVGIDAANLELVAPPEIYAGAFRFLRAHPIDSQRPICSAADRLSLGRDVRRLVKDRRLHATYHVGEDFRHLLSGLRAIDETLSFLDLQPGDRLGHAIALAIDPGVWARHVGDQIVETRQAWLDTLVWVLHLLGPGDNLVGQLEIENHIQRLSARIFGPCRRDEKLDREWSPVTLYDAWRLRALDPYSLDRKALHERRLVPRHLSRGEACDRWYQIQVRLIEELVPSISSRNALHLAEHYWFDSGVLKRGEKRIPVDLQDRRKSWLKLCRRVQEVMEETIVGRMIAIETNPSSNLFIGPMTCMAEHPIYRLTLDKKKKRLHRKVRVTVNTDNPAVFNTTLAQQYDLLAEVLTADGVPEGEVEPWLKWLRRNGKAFSFVTGLPSTADPSMGRIVRRLSEQREKVAASRLDLRHKLARFRRRQRFEFKRLQSLSGFGGRPSA